MENVAPNGGKHEPFVRCEIKPYLRPATRRSRGRNRTAVADPRLARDSAARIFVNVEHELIGRHCKAGLLRNPGNDLTERASEKTLVEMAFVSQREVKVFGKTISLEVALLETGAALEHPGFSEGRVSIDSSEHPAENVILLDGIR